MPATILNPEDYLAPIPGDNPAGENKPFSVFSDLDEKRREVDPDQFAPDDPARPAEAKIPNWDGIIEVAKNALTDKSKDLLIAARLTEALTKEHGFAGLADGFALMKRIVEECWDRCWPDISDGDLEARGGPFTWLADSNRGARFPNSVRAVPMVRGPGGAFGWREWRAIQDGRGGPKENFDKAVQMTSRDDCQATFDALERCVVEFNGAVEALVTKIGPEAPTLSDLRSAIADCHSLAKMILQSKGPAIIDEPAVEGEAGNSGGGGNRSGGTSREDIYARLSQAADDLERLEPHSPIPHLLRRAHELGSMRFPELIRALLEDGATLSSIEKEFGLKEPPPPAE